MIFDNENARVGLATPVFNVSEVKLNSWGRMYQDRGGGLLPGTVKITSDGKKDTVWFYTYLVIILSFL